jgi:tetratricopeptide (TPR) repeat protein
LVREQQDFVQGGGPLVEKLDEYISRCDAVVHLVGEKTGPAAKRAEIDWLLARYPDFLEKFPFLADEMHAAVPAISYTQLEAWLALFHGCDCYIYLPVTFDSRRLPANDPQRNHWVSEAEPHMRRVLAIDEKSFGPEHPEVATDLSNLAALLKDTNRMAEAEPLMRRALAIDENSFGPEHPNVATDLNNLAQLLQATNRLAEAEPLMRRALTTDEKSFGPEHPNGARDLKNLARLLQDTNRRSEAEPLMRRAVSIYCQFGQNTGHRHPNMQGALTSYRMLLKEMNLDETEIARRLSAFETPPTKSTEANPQP